MSQLDHLISRRPSDGFNTRQLLRDDREYAACWTCRKKHPLRGNNADHDFQDFAVRHPAERGCVVLRFGPAQMERMVRRAERRKRRRHDAVIDFTDNASVLEAFQGSSTSLDLTSFNSLAVSTTAGWCSQYIDNHTNLYLDYLNEIVLTNVNTASSSLAAMYVFSCGTLASPGSPTPTTGASSSGTVNSSSTTGAALTFVDISANPPPFPIIKIIPYLTTNHYTLPGIFTTSLAFNGLMPPYFWLPFVNAAGPTTAASGNTWNVLGTYLTVA